jgi:hypothetical protein
MIIRPLDISLVQTCGACPEQYDAYYHDKVVGYLRLRHGHFRVHYPNSMGDVVYSASPKGDGIFEDDESDFYLNEARKAIADKLSNDAMFWSSYEAI